jgi:hypothetical protein
MDLVMVLHPAHHDFYLKINRLSLLGRVWGNFKEERADSRHWAGYRTTRTEQRARFIAA